MNIPEIKKQRKKLAPIDKNDYEDRIEKNKNDNIR